MESIKPIFKKIKAICSNLYHTYLPTQEQRLFFWGGLLIVSSLSVYVVAWIDTYMEFQSSSLPAMIAFYIVSKEAKFPFGIWLTLTIAILGLVFFVIRFFTQNNTEEGRNFKLSDSHVYGNARDISTEELKTVCEIKRPIDTDGNILGMAPGSDVNVLSMKPKAMPNKNIAIFGTPGAGKTYTICENLIVQCIRRRESVITSDTKGDLWANTVEFARANGYIVRRLDLRNPLNSYGWQALKEMKHDDARAQVFVNTIITNCKISPSYEGFAKQLLTAICLYVERSPKISDSERTLGTVYRMLSRDAEKLNDTFKKAKADAEICPELEPALDAFGSFQMASGPLAGNVINNLASSLNTLSSKSVREMLSHDEIDLTLPGKQPCIYYVSMSDQTDTMKFISSLFFAFLFQNLVDYADAQENQKLKVPCTVLFEEFAQIKVPNIDLQLSSCRSRDIAIVMIIQTVGQLIKDYKDSWRTMLADCSIHIGIAFNDPDTAREFAQRVGETTIKVKTEQHNPMHLSLLNSEKYSTGDGRREFRSANELLKMERFHCLIIWQHYDSLLTKTFGIDKNPAYPYMDHVKTTTKVPLTNYCAREIMRELEDKRVQIMNDWIANGGQPMWYVNHKNPKSGSESNKKPPVFASYAELEEFAERVSTENPAFNQYVRDKEFMEKVYALQGNQDLSNDDIPYLPDGITVEWLKATKERKKRGTKTKSNPESHKAEQPMPTKDSAPIGGSAPVTESAPEAPAEEKTPPVSNEGEQPVPAEDGVPVGGSAPVTESAPEIPEEEQTPPVSNEVEQPVPAEDGVPVGGSVPVTESAPEIPEEEQTSSVFNEAEQPVPTDDSVPVSGSAPDTASNPEAPAEEKTPPASNEAEQPVSVDDSVPVGGSAPYDCLFNENENGQTFLPSIVTKRKSLKEEQNEMKKARNKRRKNGL